MEHLNIGTRAEVQKLLEQYESTPLTSGTTLAELIRRPELNYDLLSPIDPERPVLSRGISEQVNINIKYDGYIKRQLKQVEEFTKMENKPLPEDMDYSKIKGLRLEAAEKLSKIKPLNFGQASRISGVSPADISVLMIYMENNK